MTHEMVFDPEDLTTLGMVFDESWDFLLIQHTEFGPEMRLQLAALLLHLAGDRQLGPHQIKATALRLMVREAARDRPRIPV